MIKSIVAKVVEVGLLYLDFEEDAKMNEYRIINAVPAYDTAPVSLDILKDKTSQVLEQVEKNQAEMNYLIITKKEQGFIARLEEEIKKVTDLSMDIISVEAESNFIYDNAAAARNVTQGEKPIPWGVTSTISICSVEKMLFSEEKQVYISGNAKRAGRFTFSNKVKPGDILKECGSKNSLKAMYFGYPMGKFVSFEKLEKEIELTTDYIKIIDHTDCMLDQLLEIMQSYVKESCGRCVFGYEGITQINTILSDISQKKGKSDDIELLLDLCGVMKAQVLCDIGKVAAETVLQAIAGYREEIEGHITKKVCPAAICKKFVTYHILPEKCVGCTDCADECQEDAILGKKKFIHIIDQDECVQCGECLKVCDYDAIVIAGAVKPRTPKKPLPCKRK